MNGIDRTEFTKTNGGTPPELSLVPYIPSESGIAARRVRRPRLPILLCATAILFYAMIGAEFLRDNRTSTRYMLRLVLGEIAGGIGNVYALPDAREIRYLDTSPDESTGDVSLDRLERIVKESGGVLELSNTETPYRPDMEEIVSRSRVIPRLGELYDEYGEGAPVVLIIHTHGTEAYADHAEDGYRTDGLDGVISIGETIAKELNGAGIGTLHCTVAFDAVDFNTAYYSASLAIRDYLREYPSISYVIDVHRDSIMLPDGTYYALSAEADGESAAKLMFVVGTDYAGSGHSGWRDNLALCARLQSEIGGQYDGLMRNINLRAASFNEQYTAGSMLLEVGSCANTLEEAAHSARIFAASLAREITGE